MAKKKTNKSQAIRDALAAHPDKSPIEVSEILKSKGLKISPQYVSNIKGHLKGKKKRGRKKVDKTASQPTGKGLMAAVELVKASGGLDAAKAALGTIEQLSKSL